MESQGLFFCVRCFEKNKTDPECAGKQRMIWGEIWEKPASAE